MLADAKQVSSPLVLVWDGLNTHTSRAMRELITARAWLTVFQLSAYARELNPVSLSGPTSSDHWQTWSSTTSIS